MAQRQLPGGGFLTEGSVSRQAQAPSGSFLAVTAAVIAIAVPLATLALTPQVPAARVVVRVAPPAGTLALTAHAPAVTVINNIAVPAAALTLSGHAPVIRFGAIVIDVPRASLALSGRAPKVTPAVTRAVIPQGPRLLLIENLPLRLTSQLGAFAVEQPLAQRYGDLRKTRFPLLRMTATKFFAADHPMEITRAFTGNLETKGFSYRVDSGGYTVVEFAAPVPIGTDASASGLGKRNAITGALIENPADILTDLFAISGRDDAWWGQLRSEASGAGIVLAGGFATLDAIRAFVDAVIDSCGAIWCPGMARLYPVPFAGFKVDLDRFSADGVQVSAALTDTADILRLAYDFDEVENKNQSFIQLEASPQRFASLSGRSPARLFPAIKQGVTVDLAMPMVRSAAIAEAIGRRILPWYAGERYDIAFETDASEFIRPGTWVNLVDHPQWPFEGQQLMMITNATLSGTNRRTQVTAEALVTTPTITLTQHSVGTNSIDTGGIEVDFRNGVATFTILDDSDKPVSGAYVSLDGAAPKKTNGQGQVAFTTAAGDHELDVEAAGFLPYAIGLTL